MGLYITTNGVLLVLITGISGHNCTAEPKTQPSFSIAGVAKRRQLFFKAGAPGRRDRRENVHQPGPGLSVGVIKCWLNMEIIY